MMSIFAVSSILIRNHENPWIIAFGRVRFDRNLKLVLRTSFVMLTAMAQPPASYLIHIHTYIHVPSATFSSNFGSLVHF